MTQRKIEPGELVIDFNVALDKWLKRNYPDNKIDHKGIMEMIMSVGAIISSIDEAQEMNNTGILALIQILKDRMAYKEKMKKTN